MSALYDFHVGSTVQHDAHENDDAVAYLARHYPGSTSQRLWGTWDGDTERTAMFTVELPTDAVAERLAGILAALTGNDCVMVVRLARDADSPAGGFGDRGRFRVSPRTVSDGNRTLFSDPFGRIAVGDEIQLKWGQTGTVTRRGSIAGFMELEHSGSEYRFSRDEVDYSGMSLTGVTFSPDRQGSHVAFLAWQNGTISPVQ